MDDALVGGGIFPTHFVGQKNPSFFDHFKRRSDLLIIPDTTYGQSAFFGIKNLLNRLITIIHYPRNGHVFIVRGPCPPAAHLRNSLER